MQYFELVICKAIGSSMFVEKRDYNLFSSVKKYVGM